MPRGFPLHRRRRRLALVALVLTLLMAPGCFVFDELDGKGVTGGGPKPSKAAKTQTAEPVASSSNAREKLQAYYNRRPRRRVEEDPSDPIVGCLSGGRVEFMRKHQCELRGGRIQD
jgi:hypothetical protein